MVGDGHDLAADEQHAVGAMESAEATCRDDEKLDTRTVELRRPIAGYGSAGDVVRPGLDSGGEVVIDAGRVAVATSVDRPAVSSSPQQSS